MIIKEYRVTLPMTVEEYQVALVEMVLEAMVLEEKVLEGLLQQVQVEMVLAD